MNDAIDGKPDGDLDLSRHAVAWLARAISDGQRACRYPYSAG